MVKKKSLNKFLVIALHVLGWALLFMLPFRFAGNGPRMMFNNRTGPPSNGEMMNIHLDADWIRIETITINVLLAVFFYTNMFVLVPKVLNKKGWLPYMPLVALGFVIYILSGYLIRLNVFPDSDFGGRNVPVFIAVPSFFMVFGLSLALRIIQDRASLEDILKEQENERLKSELSFLRSQVSPHFMFNVLNSLAALARKKSDKVESAIIQLSQLMRYTLYHSDKKVSLEQEADYLSNYIGLQRLRFGATVQMHYHVEIERKDLLIEPMLLVPFVENAFKHGVGLIDSPVIYILLEGVADQILFTVKNKYDPASMEIRDESSGIGMANVKRRLDLLYKDQYMLKINKTHDNWFITELKIISV